MMKPSMTKTRLDYGTHKYTYSTHVCMYVWMDASQYYVRRHVCMDVETAIKNISLRGNSQYYDHAIHTQDASLNSYVANTTSACKSRNAQTIYILQSKSTKRLRS